jgi:hypothetical protein
METKTAAPQQQKARQLPIWRAFFLYLRTLSTESNGLENGDETGCAIAAEGENISNLEVVFLYLRTLSTEKNAHKKGDENGSGTKHTILTKQRA